jgi:hypothetical protein
MGNAARRNQAIARVSSNLYFVTNKSIVIFICVYLLIKELISSPRSKGREFLVDIGKPRLIGGTLRVGSGYFFTKIQVIN